MKKQQRNIYNLLVKLLLKRWTEVSCHLSKSITCCIPDSRMLQKQYTQFTYITGWAIS